MTANSRKPLKFSAEALLIFLTMLPVTGVVPILKQFVMDGFGASEFQTHLFLSFNMVSAFLFAPVVGALADEWGGRKKLIILAAVGDGLCFALMPFLSDYISLMALRFLEGIVHITVLSLLLSMAGEKSESQNGSTMGIIGASLTFGVALGSPLGGMLGHLGSTTLALLTGAAIMIIVAVLSVFLLSEQLSAVKRPHFKEIVSTLFSFPSLRLPFLFGFLDRFTVGFFVASFPLYCSLKFQATPAQIGLNIAAFMLTMGILCWPVVKLSRYFSKRALVLSGSLIYGILFAFIGSIPESLLVGWMILIGAASAVMFIPTLQLAAQGAPAYAKATAMGGFNSSGALGFLLGPLVSGLLFTYLKNSMSAESSYAVIFFIGGSLEAVVSILLFALGWLKDGEPAFPAEKK